jgi:hypothetical protein
MTINAIRWRPFKNSVDVAAGAGSRNVFTGQFEGKLVMVDGSWPSLHIMAKGTIRSILPLVLIVFLVAGVAIGRRTFEDVVGMTTLTSYAGMLASQWKGGQVMVNAGRSPAFGFMAGGTIRADPVRMRIILFMTGSTICWRGAQVSQGMCILMTFITGYWRMLPGHLEGDFLMVECLAVGVFAIMTGQAGIPKCQQVGLHEIRFDLLVAGGTNSLVKFDQTVTAFVTVVTTEGGPVGLYLVGND